MPSRPAPTARSSSRSSKRSDGAARPAALPIATPDVTAVEVGRLGSAHGLRGQLRFWPHQPGAPSLGPARRVLLERDGTWLAATVEILAAHGRGMLLTLDGVGDRDRAATLTGMRVLVRPRDLPPLAEGEFYHHEVHGFAVATTEGRALGTIAETFSTGLNDVWVIHDGEREYLIPIIADVVREIDRAGRRVVIEPMPGLLD
jgi:16S rRNA processing protein RimM